MSFWLCFVGWFVAVLAGVAILIGLMFPLAGALVWLEINRPKAYKAIRAAYYSLWGLVVLGMMCVGAWQLAEKFCG